MMVKIQYLGSGIEVINYPEEEITLDDDPKRTVVWITSKAETVVNRKATLIKERRGQFISECIDIENLLGKAISNFFFETDSEKRELFHIFLLDTITISFKQKENLLRLIMEKHPEKFTLISPTQRQEMITKINDLIKKRNAFAHGKIVIDFEAKETALIFYNNRDDKIEKLPLTEQLFSELDKHVVSVCQTLLQLFPSDCATSISYGCVRIDQFFEGKL